MKILLINSPIRIDARPNCIPYGLATIASILRNEGHEVEIYDINAVRPERREILAYLSQKTWDLIGVSGLITTFNFQLWLIHEIKTRMADIPVVSGGGLATSSSELLFKNSAVDITVMGEGEQTMLELCRLLEKGDDIGSLPGIAYRKKGTINFNPARKNIDDLE